MTTGESPVDDLVWRSAEPFDRRARHVVVTWAAIERVLSEDRPIGADADEYLALHRWLGELDGDAITRLAHTPEAYIWVRRTEQALADCVASPTADGGARAELVDRLDEVKAVLLGVAVATGRTLRFDRPLSVRPPLSLAATDLLITGARPVPVLGAERGEVLLGDRDGADAAIVAEPTLPARHGSIRLSPFVLQSSDIESRDRATVLDYGREGHARALPLMEATFDLLAEYAPDAHAHIVAAVDTIALHDPEHADRSQATLSDVPGVFAMPCSPNPYTNVECVIHEYLHNRLFALEEMGRVFTDEVEEAGGGAPVYSPWRNEVRPLKGLLHSAYVFAPVAEFWFAVWRAGRAGEEQLAAALDETVRHGLQLRMGVELLRTRADLTPWGTDILDALERRAQAFLAACEQAGVPEDTVAMSTRFDGVVEPLRWTGYDRVSVRENIRANIDRCDVNGDTRALSSAV